MALLGLVTQRWLLHVVTLTSKLTVHNVTLPCFAEAA